LLRRPNSDNIPKIKPKWLSSKTTPTNNHNFIISKDYPSLMDPEKLQKTIAKREVNAKKDNKTAQVYFKETGDPIEWLRRSFWTTMKEFKST